MEYAVRRCALAATTLATAGALTLTPVTVAPPQLTATHISAPAVQLTNVWSDLAAHTVTNVTQLAELFLGTGNAAPLPSPTLPLAPVATQLVLNQLIYVAQVFTGQGGKIPGEISTHLTEVGTLAGQVFNAVPAIVVQQLLVPLYAAQKTVEYVAGSANPVGALFEAPALFLDLALNSDAGLLGSYGPIGLPLYIRNLLAEAIYTPPPTIVLPFKKPAAASTPKAAATRTPAPKAPSGTASSARSKPKAAAGSNRTAGAAKSSGTSGAHSKRG
ncbi:hypothetical protein [Mycolicibacterium aichiense]|uniref:PE-PGRS family protein n=1 Tax=Mycolicibacterium aichiense TaxID=1799 RepID=A0AAD1HJP5_9MYCO|nr:hypothetical protein [Mycolicibacterium aichiense]MCV7019204.1 hypothetical protein [Mycolicibacterium aichiense]BBX06356.1 hypothetical protein MAIC_11590 [Mycolicibacterium aichiense]STZ24305.1 Uncharacterised protein [Mycolicibacterium aichiense]